MPAPRDRQSRGSSACLVYGRAGPPPHRLCSWINFVVFQYSLYVQFSFIFSLFWKKKSAARSNLPRITGVSLEKLTGRGRFVLGRASGELSRALRLDTFSRARFLRRVGPVDAKIMDLAAKIPPIQRFCNVCIRAHHVGLHDVTG